MGILIVAGLLVCIGVVSLVFQTASLDTRVQRLLRNAPLTTAAQFDERYVAKLQGTLRCVGEPLRAPVSGRPCAYYEIIVEARSGNHWSPVAREHEAQDFLLEDGSGVALVRMAGAQVSVTKDIHVTSGLLYEPTFDLEVLLTRLRKQHQDLLSHRELRLREGVLEAGETVAVCGRGVREPDPDPHAATGGYRDTAMRLTLSSTPQVPLLVSDDITVLAWAAWSKRRLPARDTPGDGETSDTR